MVDPAPDKGTGKRERPVPFLPVPAGSARPDLPDYPELERQMEALKAAGEFLFGRWGWQLDMAARLKVNPRTLRRWVAGDMPVDPTAWELVKLLVHAAAEAAAREIIPGGGKRDTQAG